MEKEYKEFKISKKNGKFRTIFAPKGNYKTALKRAVGELNEIAKKADKNNVCHAFLSGRNIVTNAQVHKNYNYTLSIDLKDFFDSVSQDMLKGKISKDLLELCFIDGFARQGLPTSPAIANIAFTVADKRILQAFKKRGLEIAYTRYADDLTFSFNKQGLEKEIILIITEIVKRNGFMINPKKTHLQNANNGRRIICGVAVDKELHAPRKAKRKLRAMLHQENFNGANGMRGYIALKEPKRENKKDIKQESRIFSAALKLTLIKDFVKKETTILSPTIKISGDPVQMQGMSIWTNGWTSCMAGQFKKGVAIWVECKNTRIAYEYKERKELFGIKRDKMIARALVHKVDNSFYYDRCYPSEDQARNLIKTLEKNNIKSIAKAPKNAFVGYVSVRIKPYADNLSFYKVTLKNGEKKYKIKTRK